METGEEPISVTWKRTDGDHSDIFWDYQTKHHAKKQCNIILIDHVMQRNILEKVTLPNNKDRQWYKAMCKSIYTIQVSKFEATEDLETLKEIAWDRIRWKERSKLICSIAESDRWLSATEEEEGKTETRLGRAEAQGRAS